MSRFAVLATIGTGQVDARRCARPDHYLYLLPDTRLLVLGRAVCAVGDTGIRDDDHHRYGPESRAGVVLPPVDSACIDFGYSTINAEIQIGRLGCRGADLANSQYAKVAISIVDEHVGRRVEEIRSASGLSQDQLAGLLGWPSPLLANFELGRERIGASRLAVLAQALDVDVIRFFEGAANKAERDDTEFQELQDALSSGYLSSEVFELTETFMRIASPDHRKAVLAIARVLTDTKAAAAYEKIQVVVAAMAKP